MLMRRLPCCLMCCALSSPAIAQDYPARPIRMVVPFAAGGGTDFVTRLFGQKLADAWAQQVVVDNRPGAAGIVGSDIAAKATPDGYTLVMGSGSHNVNPSLYGKLPYDTERDFAPITLIALVPIVLSAHPAVQARDARELIALARSQPGRLSYASFGVGAISHLAGELLKTTGKVEIVHVPYKGAGDALGNLLGGQVQLMFSSPAAVVPQFRSGKLKGLAVTGSQRQKAAPDIPTFSEQGLAAVDISEWYGLLAPARTPAPVLAKVRDEIVRILNTPEISERLAAVQFAEPVGSTPAQFSAFISAEIPKLAKIIRDAGIRAE
jgi:tripartite-type tricarboxylate transporter receptor subunit TctC